MNIRKYTGILAIATVLLASCSKNAPEYTRYIPKTAGYVIAFDVKSMMAKLNEDSLTIEHMMEVMTDGDNAAEYAQALEVWKQFKDAGLDFDSKVLVAVPEIDVTKGSVNFQLVAGLKDAAKLEAFVAKLPNKPAIVKENDISFIELSSATVGWNKNAVMIVGSQKTPEYNVLGADSGIVMPTPMPGVSSSKEFLKKYFELKKDESLASVKPFDELMGQKADVAVYTNSETLAGPGANPFMAFMPKMKEMMEGIYSTTTLNFEQGKIVMNSETVAGKKLAEFLKKHAGPVTDLSLIDRHPAGNVQAVTAFSFKPELIPDLLKETGLDALIGMALSESGASIDDISKAFKGDFAVLFSDFGIKTSSFTGGKDALVSSHKPDGKLVVAVRIGDKASFDKILALAEKTNAIRRSGNRIYPATEGMTVFASSSFYAGIENDLLLLSNDSALYSGYAAGKGGATIPANAKTALKNQSMGMFVDAAGILKAVPENVFDSADVHEKNILRKSKELFGDMWFSTANFDGKKLAGSGEVKLADGKNALPQLVRYLMFITEEMKQKQKDEEALYKKEEALIK